jgi:predicted ATP-grasp superfamily ATP-dependent carboligase
VAFLERTPVDLVIPCTDSALTLVAHDEARLRGLTQVAAPRAEVLHRVLDKSETMRVAADLGIPCPKTRAITTRAALQATRASLVFPLVAKPRDKTSSARFKVRYYADFDAIDAEFADDPGFGAENLIQEFSTGVGVLLGILVARGEIVAVSQQRRVREWPWSGGVSTTAVTEIPDPVLLDHARRLLTALEWDGMVEVEFRHDAASGSLVLLEVNGRFWAFNQLAVHAGVNMPELLLRSLAGERIHPMRINRPGVRMVWCTGELKRAYTVWRHTVTALRPPSLWEALSAPVREVLRGSTHAVWSFNDPLPAFAEFTHEFRAIAADEARALLRPLIPDRLLRARRAARERRMVL